MVYGVLDIRTGDFSYANAGHPEPILHRATGEIMPLGVGGPIIGVACNLPFPQETITLNRGDTIILFSDGVT